MRRTLGLSALSLALSAILATHANAQDLYNRDTPADTGVEPNPDTGPMWISEDIWIRTTPDPAYRPVPFTAATPPWTPAPHQNPEYRDPKFGIPNYVYVRVRNRGTTTSAGTEQLHLYWAKASTGLAWPASWNDAYSLVCGTNRLLGAEITKPRKNAATASPTERTALRDALVQAATNPAFDAYLAGYDYWTKQQHVHVRAPEHGNPAFLPWHREFVNRFELLLQEADPRVKLMYWNWTQDPESTSGVNLYTAAFMGASGRGTGGAGTGAPFAPALNPHPSDTSSAIVRNLSTGSPGVNTDAVMLARANYFGSVATSNFSARIEATPNHDSQHGYIGGSGGDMSARCCSTRDPFFFLLHGKVDELWARWQRANSTRQESATAYGTASMNPVLTNAQHPWDGVVPAGGGAIDPWTTTGGYIVSKTSFDRSVVSPPIYDTAPLTIPALAPGEAVVLEIPWYPPNPDNYSCLGDMRHFCLLSRITPGITTTEGMDVNLNVKNNNNLAWKNIQIVDDFTGTMAALSLFVQNDTDAPMQAGLLLREATGRHAQLMDQVAAIFVGLPPELLRRWKEGGQKQEYLRPAQRLQRPTKQGKALPEAMYLQVAGETATLDNILLKPGERFPLHVVFQLKRDYVPSRDVLAFDVLQRDGVGEKATIVGGVQYQLDLSKLVLVKERGNWRYFAQGAAPPRGWNGPRFDDAKWQEAPAPLGFGDRDEALAAVPGEGARAAYFRKRFDVQDPQFLRDLVLRTRFDDGVVVYFNGHEVHRANVPVQRDVSGAAERAFFATALKPGMLVRGSNVLAVEVHQGAASNDDMIFDAELSANRADRGESPSVAFVSMDEGALLHVGQAQKLAVDAIDPDGKVQQVALFVDDQQIATRDAAPFDFEWTPHAGPQRVRAVAIDDQQRTTTQEITVTGVDNIPPIVSMRVQPGREPGTLTLTAHAVDLDGKIRNVAFFMAENDRFDAPMHQVGNAQSAPFEVTVKDPRADHRIVRVEVTDDGGEIGVASSHTHDTTHHATEARPAAE